MLVLFGYHTSSAREPETHAAESLFDRFVQGPLTTEQWYHRIASDRLDALIYPETGTDPVTAILAATRLAPVQYVGWGHPITSGYPTIDFFLSSDGMEPEDADRHYSEKLVRLPGLSTPIHIDVAPTCASARAALGVGTEAIVYWSGQSLGKCLPRHDDLFAAIAAAVPAARFVFIEHPDGAIRPSGSEPDSTAPSDPAASTRARTASSFRAWTRPCSAKP